jgi:hypothetical protein
LTSFTSLPQSFYSPFFYSSKCFSLSFSETSENCLCSFSSLRYALSLSLSLIQFKNCSLSDDEEIFGYLIETVLKRYKQVNDHSAFRKIIQSEETFQHFGKVHKSGISEETKFREIHQTIDLQLKVLLRLIETVVKVT